MEEPLVTSFVGIIGLMIVAAAIALVLLRKVAIPSIVLFIFTGLMLGPVLGWIPVLPLGEHPDEGPGATIALVSEVGIALLLFVVGLELSLDRIRDVGKVAVAAGIGQVLFTAAGGFLIAMLLGFDPMASLFLAIALTFSSTVVVVKLLDQKGELNSLYGRIAVGIFLVQDLVAIVILTFLVGLRGEEVGIGKVGWSLAAAFAGMGLLLAGALLAARYLLRPVFNWVAQWPAAMLIWSLCWCFLFVAGANRMGLSEEIGAFLAGLSLAQLDCSHELRRRTHPLMSFFIAIFFISLGSGMEVGAVAEQWFAALVFCLFVLIGNPFIFMFIIARCGYSEKTSFLTSVTVAQISEFSFIVIYAGLRADLIDEQIVPLVALVGLVTMAASSYMILYNAPLHRWCSQLGLLRMFGASAAEEKEPGPELSDHIIVVGMNPLGRRLARDLHEMGEIVLAVDTDPRKLADLPCRTMVGNIDYPAMSEEVNMAGARLVISALQIEDTNRMLAWRCRQMGLPTVIHAFDESVVDELRKEGVAYLIDTRTEGRRQLEMALRELRASNP